MARDPAAGQAGRLRSRHLELLRQAVGGGAPFVWLFGAVAAALYAPLAVGIVLWQRAALHLAYVLVLQRGR